MLKKIRYTLYQTFEEQAVNLFAPLFTHEYLEERVRPLVIAPFYHIVSDERVDHVINIYSYRSKGQFKADLDYFLAKYQPIELPDLLVALKTGNTLKERVFLISFDDGFREIYEIVAPILKAKGVPAIFFLTTSFLDNKILGYRQKASILVEKYRKFNKKTDIAKKVSHILGSKKTDERKITNGILSLGHIHSPILDEVASVLEVNFDSYLSDVKPYLTTEQVQLLIKDGFYVGAHSVDHFPYRSLTPAEQFEQTSASAALIKQKFGLGYSLFAFPFSDYGVQAALFEELDAHIDLFFGTSAFCSDRIKNIVQRFWMERSCDHAGKILNRLYVRHQVRKIFGRNRMGR